MLPPSSKNTKTSFIPKIIASIAYDQGIIFRKFKQREKSSNMLSQFSIRRSANLFKMSIISFIAECPKMKKLFYFSIFWRNTWRIFKKFGKKTQANINNKKKHLFKSLLSSYWVCHFMFSNTIQNIYVWECQLKFEPLFMIKWKFAKVLESVCVGLRILLHLNAMN